MKNKFYNFLFLLFAILTISISCKNTKNHPQLATIDSLNLVIDTIEKTINTVDSAEVTKTYVEYQKNIKQIKLYFNDQKEDSLWSTITAYGVIRKPLKEYKKNISEFFNNIKYSRKQLDSLRTDIKADNISEEKVKAYTKSEAEAVNSLNQQVKIIIPHTVEMMHLFDSLNPKVIIIIDKLKKSGAKKASSKNKLETEEEG